MPWEVPITVDGLEYPVRFDTENEPTQEDIAEAVKQITAQKAPERPFLDITDTASALGRAATSLATTVPASLSQAWEGLENPWKRSESYMQRRQEMQALQEEMQRADEEAATSGDLSSVSSTIRQAIPSLGFSGATLAPSIAAYGGTLALTRSPTAATGAAAATSGLMAYRMAGAQFLDDAKDRIDQFFLENFERPPTEQEQEEAYNELLPLARKFGAAEAGPEALGNLALGGAGKYIRRALGGKNGITQLASDALGKVTGAKAVLAGTGATLSEIGTEAVTGVEQNRIQRQFEEGVMRGESPENVALPDRSFGDYMKSFEEVAPTTLAITGMMGAAGLGPTVIARGVRSLRKPEPEIQIAAEALNATTDTPFTDISGQAAADTIAQNTELAMRMPVQPVEEAEEVAPEVISNEALLKRAESYRRFLAANPGYVGVEKDLMDLEAELQRRQTTPVANQANFEERNQNMLPDTDNFGGKFEKPLQIDPNSYTNSNGIETVNYINPDNGLVDVYISAFGNNDFIAYMRQYDENGAPTNRWTSKLERRTAKAGATKAMLRELQSRLPQGHQYTEDVSVSTDGLRFFTNQLQQGYEVARNPDGTPQTTEVAISGESITNDLPISVDPNGKFENIRVSTPKEFAKVRDHLAKMLEKFGVGLNEKNVRWENGTVFIDLPVLNKKSQPDNVVEKNQVTPSPAMEMHSPPQGVALSKVEAINKTKADLDERAKALGYDNARQLNMALQTQSALSDEQRQVLEGYGLLGQEIRALSWEDASDLSDGDFSTWAKSRFTAENPRMEEELRDAADLHRALTKRGDTQKAEQIREKIKNAKRRQDWTFESWNKQFPDEPHTREEIDTINADNAAWNAEVDAIIESFGETPILGEPPSKPKRGKKDYANNSESFQESVRQEPQDGVESRETEETGAGDQLLRPAEGEVEEEVVASEKTIPQPSQEQLGQMLNFEDVVQNFGYMWDDQGGGINDAQREHNAKLQKTWSDALRNRWDTKRDIPESDLEKLRSFGWANKAISELRHPLNKPFRPVTTNISATDFDAKLRELGVPKKERDKILQTTPGREFSYNVPAGRGTGRAMSGRTGYAYERDAANQELQKAWSKKSPLANAEKPTPAAEGMVTPGGVATERDLTKPEQPSVKAPPEGKKSLYQIRAAQGRPATDAEGAPTGWKLNEFRDAIELVSEDASKYVVFPIENTSSYGDKLRALITAENWAIDNPVRAQIEAAPMEANYGAGRVEDVTPKTVKFVHTTKTMPGKGQKSGYYPGTYAYESENGFLPSMEGSKFVGELPESSLYTLKDADQLKKEASDAGFGRHSGNGNAEVKYLQSLGFKAMRRPAMGGTEIIVFDTKDANFQPQTKQAAETQTPESVAVDSGAAGVVQSEPSRGSILEVEKESTKTAIESTGKSAPSGYGEVVNSARKLLKERPADFKAQEQVLSDLMKLPVADLQSAFEVVTGSPTKLANKRQLANNVLNELLAEAQESQPTAAEDTFRKAEQEAEEEIQRQNAQSISNLFDKLRTNPQRGQVTQADVNQAIGALQNSGEVPNAIFTWNGTTDDLLRQRAIMERQFPGAVAAASMPNVEGVFENGMAFVFLNRIVVTDLDRRKAAEEGISPSVAAAKRVVTHENMHKGLWLLSSKRRSDIISFLRQMYPAAVLDELAKSYRQYADWRTNPVHEMALLDERLQKYIEETKTIPTDGIWKQFWDYIKEIWRKLTGQPKGEPTIQSMKDVVRLIRSALKNAHKARPDRTIDGGRVLMSVSGGRSFVPAVNIDGRVEIGASHYDAWIKHALRQIPNFKKDGLSEEERRQLADRWIVDHPEFMAYSLRKEGFVSDGEFLNRQDSLKKFKSLGGVQQMAPGEPDRDWLDASDVEGYRFSYASEQDEASSIGQQTARYAASSPRTIEAIVGVRQAYASMPKSNGAAVMLDDLFAETAKLVPTLTRPEFDRVVQGMYDDNAVLLNDAQNPSSVTILPGAMTPDIRFSIASTPEQQSAAAKFKSAITVAAKGLPDLREYEGRLAKAANGEAIDVEPHNVLWFDGFMKASEQLLSDLQKQGLSLQQIYDKVAMDTEFKRELGLFDEETGSGQAATVLSGLLLQRTLNAARKARTAEAKAQGDALHRKAAAYYSALATARGQNLLMYHLLQSDPRTRFAFMEDKVTREMLKKAEHGVNVQFGDGYAATQKAVNNAVDASAESAKTEVADAVENAAEEDQDAIDLAEGEATLDAKGKTLWEKFKDLIRKRGIAIRALNAIRSAKNARQSIAKSERDSISQMSEEELVKFIAGLDSEMETVFEQFVGGADKTTRKKREKMVKTAQKRAEKGQDIDIKPTDLSKIINQVRRDIKTPLGKPIQWREIFRQPGKTVEEYRQNIFNAVNSNEAFKDLDEAQKRRLSELFAEAWQAQRDKILASMIEQHTYSLERQQKKEAAKALRDARNQIIEAVNLGAFSNDELTRVLGEKFGFKTSFTEEEKQKLSELAEKIQDENLNKAKRNKLAREFLSTLQSGTQIPIAELLSNWWVYAVLSGGNTVSAIALSFLNGTGIGIMGTHLSRALRELMKGNAANAIDAITSLFKAYAKHISSFPTAANRAWQYLRSGDVSFLESAANDPFGRVNTLADIAKYQVVADQVAKDPNKVKAVMGRFMRFMGRLLTALDAFNVMVTKAGTVSLAIRQSGLTPEQIRDAELKNDLKFYKDKIVREDPHFGGKQPTSAKEKAYLSSLAEAEMYADLAKMGVKMENADYLASESAMTMNPTGVGGIVYNAIKALDAKVTEETRKHLQMAEIAWAKNKTVENATILFAWRAINFAAEQGLNASGLRFARFAGNKFNQSLSFVPVLGLLRMIEADNKELAGRQEAFKDTIIRNQSIGAILMFAGWAIIKAIEEEPDDEKRGWFLNGGWNNLTPDQKKQKISRGEKQYTIGTGDYVFNYQNWPISQPLAALGELSDLIRYSQDKWKAKTAGGKAGSAVISGMQAALEIPALTQVGEIFDNTMAAKDPAEQTVSRISRITSGWLGGFMPRILKDLDYIQDPTMRRYETLFQKAASHVPVYRRYVGSDYYDILGNKIEKNAIPGSRDFMKLEDKPEYRMLGALNARGIWLTPANAEYRMVGKGRFRRRLTQEEADRYSLETGKLYRQMVMNYGPRALQMPVERAKDYISAKADDMRDLALQRAVRN